MQIDEFGRKHLTLTLEIDKHIDGYVDSYFGPPELKVAVAATEKKPAAALLEDVAALHASIPTDDPQRALYLQAELRAMHCSLSIVNGEEVPFLDEVNRLYDIAPEKKDEATFEAAHAEIDALLPGAGTLAERMLARRKRLEIPAERLVPLLELARHATRKRTLKFVDLVPDEGFKIELVSDKPWGGYNWYFGNGQSRVDINTDQPMTANYLLNMLAHEAYPGHHTELILKEKELLIGRGYGEIAANLLHSPSAVISEGIATTAQEIIFPNGTAFDWVAAEVLPRIGVEDISAENMRRYAKAVGALRYVGHNVAILYHTGQLTREQAIDYIQTYGKASAERATKSFSFLSHPLYRSYTFTYTVGYDLIASASAAGDDKTDLFKQLLTEQIIPSQMTPAGLQPA
jgi:hypothetical protein